MMIIRLRLEASFLLDISFPVITSTNNLIWAVTKPPTTSHTMQTENYSGLTIQDVSRGTNQPIIRTYLDRYLNVTNPKLEDILIEDIAHGLSNVCRFGGHTKVFVSVAQHSCYVAYNVMYEHPKDKQLALAALLHDASEAYLGDMPSPIKAILPDYKNIERRLMMAIALKFGFSLPLHESIKNADQQQLNREWNYKVVKDDEQRYTAWEGEYAKKEFLRTFYQIQQQ